MAHPPANPVQELMALHNAGNFAEMERRGRAFLRAAPASPFLLELLGIALVMQGRHQEALPLLQQAAQIRPDEPQFWENLALCQRQLNQFEDAANGLKRSLALRPRSVETLNALASILRSMGRLGEARATFELALSIAPDHVASNVNLAKILIDERRNLEAEQSLARAMAALKRAQTGFSIGTLAVWDIVASVLQGLGRVAEANDIYKKCCSVELTPIRALAAILPARRTCDWNFSASLEPLALGAIRSGSEDAVLGFASLLFLPDATPADQLSLARSYARTFSIGKTTALRRTPPGRQGRIRIGYLSNEFCNHPVGYVLADVIEAHDRRQFEIVAFDYSAPSPQDDKYRRRFQQAFDAMDSIYDLSDAHAAQFIADRGIDVIVDLKGWTTGDRAGVLIPRPAPLQVQWLGYPGTTGAPWIDYLVADFLAHTGGQGGRLFRKDH